MRWLSVSWGVLMVVLSAGCQASPDLDTPPPMQYGEEVCDQCRMIISEARFAAAYVTRQGVIRRFDDIGDLLAYHATHAEDVAVFWVHDYSTHEWLKAKAAFFVVSERLHTPMGHGIVAFSERPRAAALAATTQGKVMTFAALQNHPVTTDSASVHSHGKKMPTGNLHRH